MKINDIAQKNRVAVDDLFSICKELEIKYSDESSAISDNDAFLVQKRIESIQRDNKRKAEEQSSKAAGSHKIKLKRKVTSNVAEHIKSEIEKHTGATPAPPAEVAEPAQPPQAAPSTAQPVQAENAPASRQHEPRPARESGEPAPRVARTDNRDYRDGNRAPRPQGQGDRPYTPRPQGDRPYTPRPQGQGDRPYTPRPQGDRPYTPRPQGQGDRPYTPRPQGQGDRPYTPRPQGDRPYTPRPQGQGDRPYTPRPQGQGGNRPYGQRPPQGQGGNRPFAQQGGRSLFGQNKPRVTAEEPPSFTDDKHVAGKSKRNKEKDKEKENWKTKKVERIDKDGVVSKTQYNNRKKRPFQEQKPREAVTPDHIEITENIAVGELSKKLNVKASEVIVKLLKLGVMATINQVLDAETAEILCSEYGTSVKVVSLYDETVIKEENLDNESDRVTRPPIVTVMGHVDHGKTKLLDAIRKTHVAEGEHGGITQHIGAYTVKVKDQLVTFLDTPGHAAFTTMRARGASVTDIVVLVVAANDGVMPQTIEAINHAKEAKVPIIVAINKIDLPEANIMKVKQALAGYDLVPEEWGGQTLFAEISAKSQINIDGLLDLIFMQAEILELKANPAMKAVGTVLEAKLDPGRGVVATLLVQKGSLSIGDSFIVGIYSGRVRAMFDDTGKPVTTATPSMPVEVLGIEGIPSAGDPFQQVASDKYAKQISQKRQELRRIESAKKVKKVTLEDLNELIKVGAVQDVCIIIKADVDGSVQALKDALEKLSTAEVRVKVIHAAAGGINESDIMLASASNALVIGYHVRPTPKISDLADQEKVSIKTYNIIFEVTNDIKAAMEGMLAPDVHEEVLGNAEVRQIFKISKVGTIAGCVAVSGKIVRTGKIRLLRDGVIVFDGVLKSLKRFKDDAKEVEMGQECGIGIEGYNDLKEGDLIECYKLVEVAKKLD